MGNRFSDSPTIFRVYSLLGQIGGKGNQRVEIDPSSAQFHDGLTAGKLHLLPYYSNMASCAGDGRQRGELEFEFENPRINFVIVQIIFRGGPYSFANPLNPDYS